jgi:peptide/nickel transport system substrate-binding protein
MHKQKILVLLLLLLFIILIVGCVPGFIFGPTATPIPPTLTPTPLPRTLTICLGQEPDSLYIYGTVSPASQIILRALFNGPMDNEENKNPTTILEKAPSIESGDVKLEPIDVKTGDEIVDADGNLVSLSSGVTVFPHGCTSAECVLVWDGTSPLQLDRLKIDYQLKAGLKWSDGQPLNAADSVYSFQVASDPVTPVLKNKIDLTSSYIALDERTVQWVSKPGLLTTSFEEYFWLPLPQHLWNQYTPQQMLTTDDVSKRPVGWGPYILQNWTTGKSIHMVKNPNYFRSGEGLPKFDFLDFVFLKKDEDPVTAIKTGKCDFIDKSAVAVDLLPSILERQSANELKALIKSSNEWEILALGIKPVSYDDGYYPYGTDRPAFFDDLRTRQAIALCIDRQGFAKDYFSGKAEIPISSLPSGSPLLSSGLSVIPYDPVKADQLLTATGWMDYDNNPVTPRISFNVKNVPNGKLFSLNLLVADSGIPRQIAERMVVSLAQCGIQVKLIPSSFEELFKPAPDGLVFGRKFDLAQFSMQTDERTNCLLFESNEIPTQLNFWMGKISGGANFTGYSNSSLDTACQTARRSGLNTQTGQTSQQQVNQIINQNLPVIPLYFKPEIYLSRSDLCRNGQNDGLEINLSELDSWDIGSSCK